MGTPDDDDDESKKGHRELLTPEPNQLGKYIQPYACATILFLAFILMVLFGLHDLASGWHNHVDHSDSTYTSAGRPKNVIFMVSDGFGEAGLTLARTYKNTVLAPQPVAASKQPAEHVPLYLDTFNVGSAHTYSADSLLTDSAAGATAWACGLKANNYQIAVTPLERPCATLMEAAKAKGMRTGLVVTSSLTDATPAAFSSHVRHRGLEHSIALQHATDRTADVLLGGGRRFYNAPEPPSHPNPSLANQTPTNLLRAAGYEYVETRDELLATALGAAVTKRSTKPLLGLFSETNMPYEIDRRWPEKSSQFPSLSEMAISAVQVLSQLAGEEGFFLMVEGSKIDKAAHPNDPGAHLHEILEFDKTVGAMLRFAEQDGRTLVISTSDHETGGLALGRSHFIKDGNLSGPLGDGTLLEAPLATRTLLGEAYDLVDEAYTIELNVLRNQSKSAESMVAAALAHPSLALPTGRAPTVEQVAVNATQRAILVGLLRNALELGCNLGPLTAYELAFVRSAVELMGAHREDAYRSLSPLTPQGSYGLVKMLGNVLSARAKLGWSTFGHTGQDVKVHAAGVGASLFAGTKENTQLGRIVADLLRFNLTSLNASLATLRSPTLSEKDRAYAAEKNLTSYLSWGR